MPPGLDLEYVYRYVESQIGTFHQSRILKLESLKLKEVLVRKNPYLFKAKYTVTAEHLIRHVLDAYLSSQEETLFGSFLEGLAVYVCGIVYNGRKPQTQEMEGIDLIFSHAGRIFIIEIKSGPHWGNSSQIKKMILNFEAARTVLTGEFPNMEIIAVNGCCYGKERSVLQGGGAYYKLCGQDFWRLISGVEDFYTQIIEPLGHQASAKNSEFEEVYTKIINRFTGEFIGEYCFPSGAINWEKLVQFVSQRSESSLYPFADPAG